jgi:hemoglobin
LSAPENASRLVGQVTDPTFALYERIGGETAIMAAVTLFYEKVLAAPDLAQFFEGMDMPSQINKQVAFMTMAFGGPHAYTGRDLAVAHAGLVARGLNDGHFDKVTVLLKESLDELQVATGVVSEVLEIVETTRDAVLGRAHG